MQVGIIPALATDVAAVTAQQELLEDFCHVWCWKCMSLSWCYQAIVYINIEKLYWKWNQKEEKKENIMGGILHFYTPFKS